MGFITWPFHYKVNFQVQKIFFSFLGMTGNNFSQITSVTSLVSNHSYDQTSANWGPDSTFIDGASSTRSSSKPSSSWVIKYNFKLTQITLEPSFDHLFATFSYTSYWWVGKFLTNSNRRSSYLPKFDNDIFMQLSENILISNYNVGSLKKNINTKQIKIKSKNYNFIFLWHTP